MGSLTGAVALISFDSLRVETGGVFGYMLEHLSIW
jgi:hypothetical protein